MVKRVVRNVREFGERTVKVKWVVPAYVVLGLVSFGLFVGYQRYSDDQREDAAADLALVELLRCEQRVAGREEVRGMFSATFDLIEELNPASEFAPAATLLLDTQYPELELADCLHETVIARNGHADE